MINLISRFTISRKTSLAIFHTKEMREKKKEIIAIIRDSSIYLYLHPLQYADCLIKLRITPRLAVFVGEYDCDIRVDTVFFKCLS